MFTIVGRSILMSTLALWVHAFVLCTMYAEPAAVPARKQWTARDGVLELKTPTIRCASGSQLEEVAAKLLSEGTRLGVGNWAITDKLDASVWLKIGDMEGSDSPDAYTLEVGSVVVITGNSPSGVAQGARTLLEMVAKDKAVLPRGTLASMPEAETAAPAAPANAAQTPAANVPAPPAVDAAFAVPPYLQDLRTNEVTVMWWSANPAYGWVEYGKTEALGEKADTVIGGLREVNVCRHAVRLPRLAPGTRYWYRASLRAMTSQTASNVQWGAEIRSPVYSFTTPSPQESAVRCVILADTHNNATFGPLLSLPGVQPFDFSVFNGDCFGDIKREGPCLELLRAYLGLVDGASRPAVFVRGNHDLRNWYGPFLRNLFTWPGDHPYFAFTRGPVRFVVLECGEAARDGHPMCGGTLDCSSMRVQCAAWLEREIASDDFRRARWHILIVHIPLYGDGCSEHSRPLYLPVLDKTRFDLELNGHIHVSKLMEPGAAGNPHPVVSVGGFCTAVGVFEANADGWSVKVIDTTGKVLVEKRGGH